jgi:Asp-tRNA(Asn)/Glu-tRNA(Gln) amidotransferase A subunit family amidase
MALSWTMDKLGPIARSVNDCSLILEAISGPDGKDLSAAAIHYDATPVDLQKLRIGYLKSEFDPPEPVKLKDAKTGESADDRKKREEHNVRAQADRARRVYDQRYELAALDKLRAMGVNLIPVELPKGLHYGDISALLTAEAAAAFDELTRSGRDKLLTEQGVEDWPNDFRVARLYPAVEYIQASRARTLVVRQMSALFEQVDVIVTPTTGLQLVATNLSGHPALILPNGLRRDDAPKPPVIDDGDSDDIGGPGTPVSLTFLAGHYQEAKLVAFAGAYQKVTGFDKLHPKLD